MRPSPFFSSRLWAVVVVTALSTAFALPAMAAGGEHASEGDVGFLDDTYVIGSWGEDIGYSPSIGQKNAPAPQVGTFEVGENGVSPAGRVLGVGLQLGVPTGITLKYMVAPNLGIVGGLGVGAGWYFGPALSVHVDVLYHPHILVKAPYLNLSWYVGGGGWVGVADTNARPFVYFGEYVRYFGPRFWIAARGALGINIALNDLPIEFYVEGNPALVVFPGLSFGLGFSGGLRFYF